MNYTTKHFYVTMNFMPRYEENFTCVDKDVFQNKENGMLFKKRLLYDFGWGQEYGFELLPELSFNELIDLVEKQWMAPKRPLFSQYTYKQKQKYDVYWSNLYGAVSVVMQDYVEELIEFLTDKINTDYFVDKGICDNFKCFSFNSSEMRKLGKIPGGILTKSYEEILDEYEQWRKISNAVICKVYH